MNESNRKRLFIALNIPSDIKERAGWLIDGLAVKNKGARWISPAGLHLTLHFLGDLDEAQSKSVQKIMQDLAERFGQMRFALESIGAFPDIQRPRVIFLKAKQRGNESVFELQNLLGEELKKIGLNIDHRLWHPHLTLGRVNDPDFVFQIPPELGILPLKFKVSTCDLMESELTPQGTKYKQVASFELSYRSFHLQT